MPYNLIMVFILSRSDFTWVDDDDHYQCSAGKLLQRNLRPFKTPRSGITKANTIICRASLHDCRDCEHKQRRCPKPFAVINYYLF